MVETRWYVTFYIRLLASRLPVFPSTEMGRCILVHPLSAVSPNSHNSLHQSLFRIAMPDAE